MRKTACAWRLTSSTPASCNWAAARALEAGGRRRCGRPRPGHGVGTPLLRQEGGGRGGASSVGHHLPAAKIYNDCGIPNITPAATNPAITEAGYDDTFRVIANDRAMVNALLDYAVKHQGVKRIAIVDDRTAYGQGIVKLFEAAAAERDVQIVDKQYTSDKATQFRPFSRPSKAANPMRSSSAGSMHRPVSCCARCRSWP
jgi:branched-chain amino acid transport system substrate-binding protein